MSQDPNETTIVRMILSAPALRNLVGNDPELQVQLKSAAVREVLKNERYLSESAEREVQAAFDKIYGKVTSVWDGRKHSDKFCLSQTVLEAIRAHTDETIKSQVSNYLSEIKNKVAELVDEEVKKRVDAEVAIRVRQRVDAALSRI